VTWSKAIMPSSALDPDCLVARLLKEEDDRIHQEYWDEIDEFEAAVRAES